MLQVVNVDATELDNLEQLGTKPKFWYDEFRYLFKARREGTGEDWAEVVSARLASLLGLPHASYDLAEAVGVPTFDMVRGVRSANFTPLDGRLVLGNELIGPVASSEKGTAYAHRRQFHTPSRVAIYLGIPRLCIPLGWAAPVPIMTAKGVMAGYLMLDVLIGNQDRHEENWGIIVSDKSLYLAPTFDHASSLGRNEVDDRRRVKLETKDPRHGIPGYAAKAMSQLFEKNGSRLTTLDAFVAYSQTCKAEVSYWLAQLVRVNELSFRLLLNEIPDSHITEIGREFAVALLIENRRRLLALTL